jgi:hypothetical protein
MVTKIGMAALTGLLSTAALSKPAAACEPNPGNVVVTQPTAYGYGYGYGYEGGRYNDRDYDRYRYRDYDRDGWRWRWRHGHRFYPGTYYRNW